MSNQVYACFLKRLYKRHHKQHLCKQYCYMEYFQINWIWTRKEKTRTMLMLYGCSLKQIIHGVLQPYSEPHVKTMGIWGRKVQLFYCSNHVESGYTWTFLATSSNRQCLGSIWESRMQTFQYIGKLKLKYETFNSLRIFKIKSNSDWIISDLHSNFNLLRKKTKTSKNG